MTTPLTAQQSQVIIQSAQVFEDGVNAMNSIYSEVFAAGDQLRGQAMVSTAGQQFSVAITRWTDDFNNIRQTLQAMHDQLLSTTSLTTSTNMANSEIAAALAAKPGS
jgi:NADPH-dependent glutamate synthase beta subunit-like oxidoreductase